MIKSLLSCLLLMSFGESLKAGPDYPSRRESEVGSQLAPQVDSQAKSTSSSQSENARSSSVLAQTSSLSSKSEAEIPVVLTSKALSAKEENPYARLLLAMAVVLGVAGGGMWMTKKLKLKQGLRDHAPAIKIINQHHLGPKKSLAIVSVAGESILIGITDTTISHIRTLSLLDDEIPENPAKNFDQAVEDSFTKTQLKDLRDLA